MPPELSESETFALLASRRRRMTVQVLAAADSPVTTSELAERIATREDPTVDDHHVVEFALNDEHLPRLEEAAVVSRDSEAGTVDVGPNFSAVLAVLENVSERDLPWTDQ